MLDYLVLSFMALNKMNIVQSLQMQLFPEPEI